VAIDNPNAPSIARCDEPGCNRSRPIVANARRDGENELAADGWYWQAIDETVMTYCPTHSSQPVRRRRKGS
jgi:hypothetical protein